MHAEEKSSSRSPSRMWGAALVVIGLSAVAAVLYFRPTERHRRCAGLFDIYVSSNNASKDAIAAFRLEGDGGIEYLCGEANPKFPLRRRYCRLRSSSRRLYQFFPAERDIDWKRINAAIKLLGEMGESASNAVPSLIRAATNYYIRSVNPISGNQFGGGVQSFETFPLAMDALAKIGAGSKAAFDFCTNRLSTRINESYGDRDLLALVARLTPPKICIPSVIDMLRSRQAFRPSPRFLSSSSGLESYMNYVEDFTPTRPNPAPGALETIAYAFAMATNLPPEQRRELAEALLPAARSAGGETAVLLRESIAVLDRATAEKLIVSFLNQTEHPDFQLRLRALECIRVIRPVCGIEQVRTHVQRRLKDEVPIVRIWAAETLRLLEEAQ